MNDEEVIEILDDFEDNTIRIEPIKNVNIGIKPETVAPSDNVAQPLNNPSLGVSKPEELEPKSETFTPVKNLDTVKYEPIKPETQEFKVETPENEEESRSGLGFVIVLFILLAAFIIALPYISKLF